MICAPAYLEEIQSVRRHTNSSSDPKNTNLPVLVHCSAGVGRTGVVILSEIMIACLEHNEVQMSCACCHVDFWLEKCFSKCWNCRNLMSQCFSWQDQEVPAVLNLLRQQRMMMVQTLSQYTFVYKVLIQFLKNSRLIWVQRWHDGPLWSARPAVVHGAAGG